MNLKIFNLHIFIWILIFAACQSGTNTDPTAEQAKPKATDLKLWELVPSGTSNIDFSNDLPEDIIIVFYIYINAYSGGGVSLGDINNDGLVDIYFTGNIAYNKLYLNKGDFVFEDISETAGVQSKDAWCTGSTMVDINNDGFLDIYVNRASNDGRPHLRKNLLYINNGDLTFTDQAGAYGIDDVNHSIQSVFFDYDNDNDLDLYVGNFPREFPGQDQLVDEKFFSMPLTDEGTDNLFRNNGNNSFTKVTKEAGLFNRGWLLGLLAWDINEDGWTDLYLAIDHAEPDKMYINQKDGSFKNIANESLGHMTNFSMGVDFGDINNDGLLDLFVVDMMAADNYRQKTLMSAMAPEEFWTYVKYGYHYQYMRNCLQLNNGDESFSEVAYLAGVANTDWSWAVLFQDYDNDGLSDIIVTNGIGKDVRNNDYVKALDKITDEKRVEGAALKYEEIKHLLKEKKLPNYYFKNKGDLRFSNEAMESGFSQAAHSNGAAYADLDNDGDLDLVINNLGQISFVYKNNAVQINNNHYLRIKLKGEAPNLLGLGSRIKISAGDKVYVNQLTLTRGFQSSVEPIMHFGLGTAEQVDKLEVIWPNGQKQVLREVHVDQVLTLTQKDAKQSSKFNTNKSLLFNNAEDLPFTHRGTEFDDYETEILIPHKMSEFGPKMASGDINGDGLIDFYTGGAAGQSGVFFVQNSNGSFNKQNLGLDIASEDVGSVLFDADQDGDLDLYVVSGSNEFGEDASELQDRLYLNNGSGKFSKSREGLPKDYSCGSCVAAGDYDNDGDLDLFVGGRGSPGRYPYPSNSALLTNDNGKFTNTTALAEGLQELGMVTSAVWSDYDQDGSLDLILVGEWMPITVYKNEGSKFTKQDPEAFRESNGWWNKIVSADMDGDGDMDYIAGNYGENCKFNVSVQEPLHVYCYDFDESGTLDIVLGYYNQGLCFPVRGRECSSQQMPNIKEKFPSYHDFGVASLAEVYGDQLGKALHYEAYIFASVYIENLGAGRFQMTALPVQAQISSVFGIVPADLDHDGNLDLLIAGNFFPMEIETGRNDAGKGLLLLGDGNGNFEAMDLKRSGSFAAGDVRDLLLLESNGMLKLVVARNQDVLNYYNLSGKPVF